MLQVEAKNKKWQELNRFVHYYSRFKNHENSYKVLLIFTFTIIADNIDQSMKQNAIMCWTFVVPSILLLADY